MTYRILSYTIGLILALLLVLNLSSCTEDITLNTDNATPVIVIYGTITDEPIHQEVHISASTGYFETTKNPKISGAIVTITTGSGDVYTLKEVSSFVTDKLSAQESVLNCATHFIMRKYKMNGTILAKKYEDEKMLVTP